MLDEIARLRVNCEQLGTVEEVVSYLSDFEDIYNNLYALELFISEEKERFERVREAGRGKWTPIKKMKITDPKILVRLDHQLRVNKIHVESPGFWEFAGSLNPLEVIRNYLNDRHERKKDIDYRNLAERKRLDFENREHELALAHNMTEFLKKDLEMPIEQVRSLITENFYKPIEKLGVHQDNEIFIEANLDYTPEGEEITVHDSGPDAD